MSLYTEKITEVTVKKKNDNIKVYEEDSKPLLLTLKDCQGAVLKCKILGLDTHRSLIRALSNIYDADFLKNIYLLTAVNFRKKLQHRCLIIS